MMSRVKQKIVSQKGLTLPEMLISTLILVIIYAGMIVCYTKGIQLFEATKSTSLALDGVRNQMIAIERTAYDQIVSTFDNTTFTINGLTGIGTIDVDAGVTDLLTVNVNFCWQESNGRVIGEDLNLNGIDNNEDANNNGLLDSPVGLATTFYNIN